MKNTILKITESYGEQQMTEKRTKRKWLWLCIYLLYTSLIFANSLDPADVSSLKSGAVLQFLNSLLFSGHAVLTDHIVRKLAHFTEYAIAGILGWQAFSHLVKSKRQCLIDNAFAGLLTAFCDETIQLFVPGRSGQVSDMWIDFSGYLTGTLCVLLILAFLKWYRSR